MLSRKRKALDLSKSCVEEKNKTFNSLNAMGTFMCPYKIEKSMYFILTPNIKSPYKFT